MTLIPQVGDDLLPEPGNASPQPLTDADCRALGLTPLSRERDDDMGARWVRTSKGKVAICQRREAFYSRDPEYGNLRSALTPLGWPPSPHLLPSLVLRSDGMAEVLCWLTSDIPPEMLAKCFNADQIPAWEAATDWQPDATPTTTDQPVPPDAESPTIGSLLSSTAVVDPISRVKKGQRVLVRLGDGTLFEGSAVARAGWLVGVYTDYAEVRWGEFVGTVEVLPEGGV